MILHYNPIFIRQADFLLAMQHLLYREGSFKVCWTGSVCHVKDMYPRKTAGPRPKLLADRVLFLLNTHNIKQDVWFSGKG